MGVVREAFKETVVYGIRLSVPVAIILSSLVIAMVIGNLLFSQVNTEPVQCPVGVSNG